MGRGKLGAGGLFHTAPHEHIIEHSLHCHENQRWVAVRNDASKVWMFTRSGSSAYFRALSTLPM